MENLAVNAPRSLRTRRRICHVQVENHFTGKFLMIECIVLLFAIPVSLLIRDQKLDRFCLVARIKCRIELYLRFYKDLSQCFYYRCFDLPADPVFIFVSHLILTKLGTTLEKHFPQGLLPLPLTFLSPTSFFVRPSRLSLAPLSAPGSPRMGRTVYVIVILVNF